MKKVNDTIRIIGFFIAILFAGTTGFVVLEDMEVWDGIYLTALTITTVGYGDIVPTHVPGKIFTIVLVFTGVGLVLYSFTKFAETIVEGGLQNILEKRKMKRKVAELRNHYIVCGYGRMGKIICRELREKNIKFVVVEKKPDALEEKGDMLIIEGDATRDEILREVGIERAKGLISVLPTDAENLFVVLSARELNPRLFIVARAGEEGSEQKLMRAGADRVVSPYHIGGLRIAHTVLKPAVVDFIEFATKSGNIDLQMEEITIQEDSKLAGLTLDECGIGRELGIIIVAIKRPTGDMRFNPTFRTNIKAGDTLIALGEISKLKTLEDMAGIKR